MTQQTFHSHYVTINHSSKTFNASSQIFAPATTKLQRNDYEELLKYPDYIGEIHFYGNGFTVKKVSDLNKTILMLPHESFIPNHLLGAVVYLFNHSDLSFSPDIMTFMLDIACKKYHSEYFEMPANLFTFDQEQNRYVHLNLIKFFQKNTSNVLLILEETEKLLDPKFKKVLNQVIAIIKDPKNNIQNFEDLANYSKNLAA